MPVISVIVPVYKVEPYLRRCVDSILNQTYADFELILVDDGSPDGCPAICDEYAAKDSRVIVIHKDNGGLSDARNVGVCKATGTYVTFVDSDDYVSKYYVEHLYTLLASTGADISMISQKTVRDNGENITENVVCDLTDVKLYNQEESIKGVLSGYVRQSAWGNLYPRAMFSEIQYPRGILYEDLAVVFYILLKYHKVAVSSNRDYNYLIRESSIMHSKFSMKQYESFTLIKEEFDYVLTYYPQYRDELLAHITDAELFIYYSFCKSELRKQRRDELSDFKKNIKENCKQITNYSCIKKSSAIRMLAFRLGWPAFSLVMKIFNVYINIKQYM